LEIFETKKKVVACSANNYISDHRIPDRFRSEFCFWSIHLYIILGSMKRKKIETIIILCIFLLFLARINRSWYFVYGAIGLGILGSTWKWFRDSLYFAWMKLAEWLGLISGTILLMFVFVFILIPVSFFARRKKDFFIQLKKRDKSYYIDRDHTFSREDLENPW
jgi:predicted membrane protein